jgi:hypothetical protein
VIVSVDEPLLRSAAAAVVEHCPSCSAIPRRAGTKRCEQCGALLAAPVPPRPALDGAFTANLPRFARIRESRAFQSARATRPRDGFVHRRAALRTLPFLFICLLFAVAVPGNSERTRPIPVVATIAAAGILVFAALSLMRYLLAPLSWRPALVVDEARRFERHGLRTTTRYFATLEFETGSRQEFEVTAALAAELPTGRAGVAFERDGILLHFVRVDA